MSRDQIYALPRDRVGEFTFDDAVADVFSDMIKRSVPGYGSVLSMIEQLTARYAKPNTNIYDLGCSLGAGTMLIRNQAPESCTIWAVDNSEAMVNRLRHRVHEVERNGEQNVQRCQVEVLNSDILSLNMTNASFAILNWTLQFVDLKHRDALIGAIANSLVPGGAILLSEKISFDDPARQAIQTDLHHDFKRANGYSDLEIAQKRTALENRLICESIDTHLNRLYSAGFSMATVWFQCFNFASFLAVK
jgi:tRNA (cmo5U34)-methyltransferase